MVEGRTGAVVAADQTILVRGYLESSVAAMFINADVFLKRMRGCRVGFARGNFLRVGFIARRFVLVATFTKTGAPINRFEAEQTIENGIRENAGDAGIRNIGGD